MYANDAKRVAAFLREILKQEKDACTIVMTKDLVYLLYELVKEKANECEAESETSKQND